MTVIEYLRELGIDTARTLNLNSIKNNEIQTQKRGGAASESLSTS